MRRGEGHFKVELYEEALRDYTIAGYVKSDDPGVKTAVTNSELAMTWGKGRDYYKLLNLERCAPMSAVKRAYKTLALEYHPDRLPGSTEAEKEYANCKFKLIGAAYSVLSDPLKKEMYDRGIDVDGTRGGR
ncbi:hypothetical protein SeMB42_g06317 [Synchytrium endobioticum]|nr:hypothetical protein SeMB42_g06317 [Synchytrium endobioticum]